MAEIIHDPGCPLSAAGCGGSINFAERRNDGFKALRESVQLDLSLVLLDADLKRAGGHLLTVAPGS
jgi:hypothetical protein